MLDSLQPWTELTADTFYTTHLVDRLGPPLYLQNPPTQAEMAEAELGLPQEAVVLICVLAGAFIICGGKTYSLDLQAYAHT